MSGKVFPFNRDAIVGKIRGRLRLITRMRVEHVVIRFRGNVIDLLLVNVTVRSERFRNG